jgi:hypothetical protein
MKTRFDSDKVTRQLLYINILATIGLFACLFYYGMVFRDGMKWNRELQDNQRELERRLLSLEGRRP